MKRPFSPFFLFASLFVSLFVSTAVCHAGVLQRGKVYLICHRTANADVPENTLESLAYAARMGCDVVELDLTRTLDGQIVLQHDGLLERLTDGMGVTEQTYSQELALMDAGSWMGARFGTMRIPKLEDVLRMAHELNIGLYLDFKSKGMGPQVVAMLKREDMLNRVRYGGEWDDVRVVDPRANEDPVASVNPGATHEQIETAHQSGKFVIGEFSANHHEMDLDGMRAVIAAGADAIMVDYPRLGADAVGRPVETKFAALVKQASQGAAADRATAIFEIAKYDGFPTQALLERWILDSDDRVSRAAAIALVEMRPQIRADFLHSALTSSNAVARKNAAWTMGMLRAPAEMLIPLLSDRDPAVLQETLLALSRCPGDVPAELLLPHLANPSAVVRGAAALALARHQPEVAAKAVPAALKQDEDGVAHEYAQYVQRGKPKLTQQEIDPIVLVYRGEMKLIQAAELLPQKDALSVLEAQAFRSVEDYSRVTGLVAGYQLWDRVGDDPSATISALGSQDIDVANRAEWILVKAGRPVLPGVRQALQSGDAAVRERCIRILAWQGDDQALILLRDVSRAHPEQRAQIDWAINKIDTLQVSASQTAGLN
jgi:glycerophosphoryl diester phosphodiesterase/HEAT repeat protein